MTRLLHVFHSFALGGSQARLIRLIDALGDEFEHVIVSLTGDVSAQSLIKHQAQVRVLDAKRLAEKAWFPWGPIRREILMYAPDRILTYNWGGFDWALAALGTGIPHVAVEDGFGPEESIRRIGRRSWARRVVFGWGRSEMFVPSQALFDIASGEWGIPRERLHLIPNGVPSERYQPVFERKRASSFSRSDKEFVIGTLAGLRPEKSLDRMIDAFEIVRSSVAVPVRLVIAGAGPLEAVLRAQCAAAGLGDDVRFEGFRDDPHLFLHELDLFMLSSQTEQLPIALIEAMLCGLPVVATDVGDVRASLPVQQQPLVVERSAEALAEAVVECIQHPLLGSELGRLNRLRALDRFGPEPMLSGWQRIFRGLGSDSRESGPHPDRCKTDPHIIVFSSLFPSTLTPQAGVFIRERMFRVGRYLPLSVVSPQPWSPFDRLIRAWRPAFRVSGPVYEQMAGVHVHRPRYFSLPGIFKGLDGWSMARASRRTIGAISRSKPSSIIDAHFAYPDGYAASLLARWLKLTMTLTLRGSKDTLLLNTPRESQIRRAVLSARSVFAVSDALRDVFSDRFELASETITVVRNGVDTERFQPVDRRAARERLGISMTAKVMISVGWLVEGKGHHRLLPILERMRRRHPELQLLIVGGNAGTDDGEQRLRSLVGVLGLEAAVQICGLQPADQLKWFYGAADVFALATRTEGWANVLLESMACGVPVVTTRVGGNAQVVASRQLGLLTEFWDEAAFEMALESALYQQTWNSEGLVAHARASGWDEPVQTLVRRFRELASRSDRTEHHNKSLKVCA
jgi:glycosyltransferase involved in cell wall biosynthesis